MANFGAVTSSKVNSTMAKLTMTYGGVSSEVMFLQDMTETNASTEFREPTTSAGPVYYSGQPNNRIQGTALFSTDLYKNATNNFNILTTRTNGEKPVFKLVMVYTDVQGSPVSDTFTYDPANGNAGAKIESVVRQKAPEGATKIAISIILIGDPVVT